jgi:hypothetical protein
MTDRALGSSPTVAAHPGISWSVVLEAVVPGQLEAREAQRRVVDRWPRDGSVGPAPEVVEVPASGFRPAVEAIADLPYRDDEARSRLVLAAGPETRVAVAGHHAVLDGLGLVAVLGAALGADLGTDVRGVERGPGPERSGTAYAAGRLAEALVRPPTRIRPAPDREPASGDHLLRATVARSVSTPDLVAAAAEAVRAWNGGTGKGGGRVVVAVGAAIGPGAAPRIGRQATWFRLPVPVGSTADVVRRLLVERGPEPSPAEGALRAARATGLASRLERRTGSTLLVSNLGALTPPAAVADAAFYPAAHGRSGVAVGAVATGGVTTVTLRARRRDFSDPAAREFLGLVERSLAVRS